MLALSDSQRSGFRWSGLLFGVLGTAAVHAHPADGRFALLAPCILDDCQQERQCWLTEAMLQSLYVSLLSSKPERVCRSTLQLPPSPSYQPLEKTSCISRASTHLDLLPQTMSLLPRDRITVVTPACEVLGLP